MNGTLAEYEKAPKVYDDLLATFGTHFMESATFGRKVTLTLALNESYWRQTNPIEITANLTALLNNVLGNSSANVSEQLTANYQVLSNELGQLRNRSEWRTQVMERPWLLWGSLRPIGDLLANSFVKKQVSKATLLKFAKAYLAQLRRIVAEGNFKLTYRDLRRMEKAEKGFTPQNCAQIPALIGKLEATYRQLWDPRPPPTSLKALWDLLTSPKVVILLAVLLIVGCFLLLGHCLLNYTN